LLRKIGATSIENNSGKLIENVGKQKPKPYDGKVRCKIRRLDKKDWESLRGSSSVEATNISVWTFNRTGQADI